MADKTKYYYLKIKENFFDTEDMKLLESMDNGYLYSNILMKMYLLSLKNNGKLMYKDKIPYNSKMLSTILNHNVDILDKAIDIFKELNLIEVLDSGAIFMLDIQNYIGKSSDEADRKRDYRNRIETTKLLEMDKCPDKCRTNCSNIKDRDKDRDKDIKKEIKKETNVTLLLSLISTNNFKYIKDDNNLFNKIKEWLEYKQERKETYKQIGLQSLLTQIENQIDIYGEDQVIDLITECMANNYKGIIFDKLKNKPPMPYHKKQSVEPEWLGKEIKKGDFSEETERLCREVFGHNKE